ncbi:hypothetical protein NDU88_000341, partial [Pleurodeles waltl]
MCHVARQHLPAPSPSSREPLPAPSPSSRQHPPVVPRHLPTRGAQRPGRALPWT